MTRSRLLRTARLGAVALAVGGLAACDLLLTDPAPATPELSVSFTFGESNQGGMSAAFDRVDRVFLQFVRADSAQRDTIVALDNRNGVARARLILDPQERISALGVRAELRAGQATLFAGAAVVRVENGTSTTAEIPLTAVPASLRADRSQASFAVVGDTLHLAAALLFASGDTVAGRVGTWTSEDPQIVAVTSGGIALARNVGQTKLFVTSGSWADTVVARVLSSR